jgi:hypothetical protein
MNACSVYWLLRASQLILDYDDRHSDLEHLTSAMTTIHQLERELQKAKERLSTALRALAPKHKGGEWEEYHAANQQVLGLERQIAAIKREEYAESLEFPVRWDVGAPMPHLLVNDYRALLCFLLNEPDPNWDGSYVNVVSVSETNSLALVEFKGCLAAKLGVPNDEVFHGHPLEGKGMEPYRAQLVMNSCWIRELETINSVHQSYNPKHWNDLNHYVFWFHDSTFECVAKSFAVDTYRESMTALLIRMVERLAS